MARQPRLAEAWSVFLPDDSADYFPVAVHVGLELEQTGGFGHGGASADLRAPRSRADVGNAVRSVSNGVLRIRRDTRVVDLVQPDFRLPAFQKVHGRLEVWQRRRRTQSNPFAGGVFYWVYLSGGELSFVSRDLGR